MAKPMSFRPTEKNLEIFNEIGAVNPDFDRTMLINRSINFFFSNADRIQELESANRSQDRIKEAHEFSLNAIFQEKREAEEAFKKELKTANNKIAELILQTNTSMAEVKQLKGQSVKYRERIEILKSKNDFLSTQASVLDKIRSKN